MQIISKKIKKFREEKNYSQVYMANELGISQSAYAKIESGDRKNLDIKRLLRISVILDVEPQELLEGEKPLNQLNNGHAYGFVENLYQDNKEMYQKLIQQLEQENLRLTKENERLLK